MVSWTQIKKEDVCASAIEVQCHSQAQYTFAALSLLCHFQSSSSALPSQHSQSAYGHRATKMQHKAVPATYVQNLKKERTGCLRLAFKQYGLWKKVSRTQQSEILHFPDFYYHKKETNFYIENVAKIKEKEYMKHSFIFISLRLINNGRRPCFPTIEKQCKNQINERRI